MKLMGTNPETRTLAYHGYLIRFSAYAATLNRPACWIEKHNHFIGHALNEADAKRLIDLVRS